MCERCIKRTWGVERDKTWKSVLKVQTGLATFYDNASNIYHKQMYPFASP